MMPAMQLWTFCLILLFVDHALAVIINGDNCISIRDIFNDEQPAFSDKLGEASVVDILFTEDYARYYIRVNGKTWLQSGFTGFRNQGQWSTLKLSKASNVSGVDAFGAFNAVVLSYIDMDAANNTDIGYEVHFLYYPSSPDVLVFHQAYIDGATDTADKTQTGDGLISSFPSFKMQPVDTVLGFAHFGGFMAAAETPQYGVWNSTASSSNGLSGGIQETGPLVLFDSDMRNSIVLSALTNHMAINDGAFSSTAAQEYRLGVSGNISSVPVGEEYSFMLTLTRQGGGVNRAMYEWGSRQLQYHGVRRRGDAHAADFTLQYLGYSTDNGAYYYYHTEPSSNYQQTMLDVAAYHRSVGLPTKWVLLDSWWYFKGENGGVKNWSARTDVFPDGLAYVHEQTGWRIQAHNRYFSTDNVYLSKFPFSCSSYDCLPQTMQFWQWLFDANDEWALTVYEQDWLSVTQQTIPALASDSNFGRAWLLAMAQSAAEHDVQIQLCMSYPRHVMTAVETTSITQARASDDYHPGNEQWRIGVSSIFNAAMDVAPSKDSFWSESGAQAGPYSDDTAEPFNRLQALVLSLSNGPYSFADQIGRSDVALIMRCCNADGLVLRPQYSATMIDKFFLSAAGLDDGDNALSIAADVWSTYSVIGVLPYYFVLSVNLAIFPFDLYPSYFVHVDDDDRLQKVESWLVFESNTTSTYRVVNESSPLALDKSDKYTFEYYTFVPMLAGLSTSTSQYYVQGEIDKWIGVSRQRFQQITYLENGQTYVTMKGAVNETVRIAFVRYPELQQIVVACTVQETQLIRIDMPSQTCTSY